MSTSAEEDTSSWSPVWTTAVFAAAQDDDIHGYSCTGAVAYILFECWRNQRNKRGIYQPRQTYRPTRTPEEPSSVPFGWLRAISKVNDGDLHRLVGMDHYVLIRHCLFGFHLTLFPSIVGVIVMIFVYRTGGNGQEKYNEITMGNITQKSIRLWWSTAFMYLVVLWALLLMWREWRNFVPKRFQFLAEGDPDMDKEVSFTVMVENIPEDKRSSPALYGYFDNLFPGKVSYASLCMHADELEGTLQEKQEALRNIEHAVAQKHLDPSKDHTTKVGGCCCCGGKKVGTEEHFRGELQNLLGDAEKEHSRISQIASQGPGSDVASSTGFVVFTSVATKLAAVKVNLSGKHDCMDVVRAPAPGDVIWENVTCPDISVTLKRKIANCLWSVGILFWAIPVVFVLGISDLDQLAARFSWLWTPEKDSFLYGLISGLLPVVALALLTALVPIFIRLVAIKFIKMKSEADVDTYVFKWHFGFRIANLWLIIIGGSIINKLDNFVDDPETIVDLLGESVPNKSQFFMSMLLVRLLSGMAMDLSRLIAVVISFVTGAFGDERGKSDRELREAQIPPSLNWGVFYPPLLFVLLVVYCYAAIAPLMLPVACLLYWWAYLVYKNQALFVYVQKADGGGDMMFVMHNFMMGCLYVGELVFVAYIGIKKGSEQSSVAVVLIIITIIWHYTVQKKFVQMSRNQCMEAAVAADNKFHKSESSSSDHPFEGKAYVQASLKKSEWETKPEGYRDPANDRKLPQPETKKIEKEAVGTALTA